MLEKVSKLIEISIGWSTVYKKGCNSASKFRSIIFPPLFYMNSPPHPPLYFVKRGSYNAV
jgi:hypothetical protein